MSNRVLSIQSHVAHGYVGNKAAVFPLQLLGYDVDVMNTVNFSNHSGYGKFGGSKASAEDLRIILQHMEGNGLLEQTRLLTGYIPGAEALSTIAQLARKLRETRSHLIYLLDPVMGDAGKMYVSQDVIPIYKSMLPLSTIITPNWFEVELLTDTKLSNLASIRTALDILHNKYHAQGVIISSLPVTEEMHAEFPERIQGSALGPRHEASMNATDYIICICSYAFPDVDLSNRRSSVHAMRVEKVSGYYSGVGDLFSALVLGHYHPREELAPSSASESWTGSITGTRSPSQNPLSQATIRALQGTYHVLLATRAYVDSLLAEANETDEEKDAKDSRRIIMRMKDRELRLIQEQDFLRTARQCNQYTSSMVPWEGFWDGVPVNS